MPAKIIVQRKKEFLNKLRGVTILVNGEERGNLKSGGVEELIVEPGAHKIQCRLNWYRSREFDVVLNEGDKRFLRVRMGMQYFGIVYVFTMIALLSDLVFRWKNMPVPDWWLFAKLGIVIPALLYFLFYITVGKKYYLVLEEDKDNIFN